MPLDSVDSLVAAFPGQIRRFNKHCGVTGAGSYNDLWLRPGMPGAASNPPVPPGEIPTRLTPGAIPFTNPVAPARTYLAALAAHGLQAGTVMLVDRLWHCTVDGTITGAQTINSPALTRLDAGGMDTELWVVSINATTAQTMTVTYTNAAGTTGRSTTVVTPGFAARAVPVPLAAGDSGIQSVQSVSVPTSTAGSLVLLALRRLGEIGIAPTSLGSDRDGVQLGFPRIYDDSCLGLLFFAASNSGQAVGRIQVVQT